MYVLISDIKRSIACLQLLSGGPALGCRVPKLLVEVGGGSVGCCESDFLQICSYLVARASFYSEDGLDKILTDRLGSGRRLYALQGFLDVSCGGDIKAKQPLLPPLQPVVIRMSSARKCNRSSSP